MLYFFVFLVFFSKCNDNFTSLVWFFIFGCHSTDKLFRCLLLKYQLCGFTTSHQQLNGLLGLCFLSHRKNHILDSKRSMIISLVWSGLPHLDVTVETNCEVARQ